MRAAGEVSQSAFKVQLKTKSLIYMYAWRLVAAHANRFDTFSRPISAGGGGEIVASLFRDGIELQEILGGHRTVICVRRSLF